MTVLQRIYFLFMEHFLFTFSYIKSIKGEKKHKEENGTNHNPIQVLSFVIIPALIDIRFNGCSNIKQKIYIYSGKSIKKTRCTHSHDADVCCPLRVTLSLFPFIFLV